MKIKKLTHLDCTLRDGGYYNEWFFPLDLVNKYLITMHKSKIDYVEIGFRFLNSNFFFGPNAFTKENYLNELTIPKKLKLAVMLNGSDLLNLQNINDLKKFFIKKKKSKISLVRVACHFNEVKNVIPKLKIIKKLGYTLAINLMQINEQSNDHIISTLKFISKTKICNLIYYADSTGGLNPKRVKEIMNLFKSNWTGEIGIHAHDNLTFALCNTLTAIDCGVNWVDSTVLGMGRGPGNVKTELLLNELKDRSVNLKYIANFIEKDFNYLYDKYKWGTDIYYYLSGQNSIHPTYIQTIKNEKRYSPEQKLFFLKNLKLQKAKSFDYNFFNFNIKKNINHKIQNIAKIFNNKKVLIIGNGKSVQNNLFFIKKFIDLNKPIVICVNLENNFEEKYIDYNISCNPLRIIFNIEKYKNTKLKLIIPPGILSNETLKNKKTLFYDANIGKNFSFSNKICILPFSTALLYSIAVINICDAKCAFYAGFDGDKDDINQIYKTNEILKQYNKNLSNKRLFSLTSTKYEFLKYPLFREI
jgi:4-hydroxy 2-oxovalerate aldolase